MSFVFVSKWASAVGAIVGLYPLEFASTTSVPGLGLLSLQISRQNLVLSQCGHLEYQGRVDLVGGARSGNVERQWGENPGAK